MSNTKAKCSVPGNLASFGLSYRNASHGVTLSHFLQAHGLIDDLVIPDTLKHVLCKSTLAEFRYNASSRSFFNGPWELPLCNIVVKPSK